MHPQKPAKKTPAPSKLLHQLSTIDPSEPSSRSQRQKDYGGWVSPDNNIGSYEMRATLPVKCKLFSEFSGIKESVMQLHQSNQRVIEKIHDKISKSRSILREDPGFHKGQKDSEHDLYRQESFITCREEHFFRKRQSNQNGTDCSQKTDRTTLNFLATIREPISPIYGGILPENGFTKKTVKLPPEGLNKHKSQTMFRPYCESDVSSTSIASPASAYQAPFSIADMFGAFENAVNGTMTKIIAKCQEQNTRLQTVAEAASLRLVFSCNQTRRGRQQLQLKCREFDELKLKLTESDKEICSLRQIITKCERKLEVKQQELADARKNFNEVMDTLKEFKEGYRLRIKMLEDQLTKKTEELAKQSILIEELRDNLNRAESRYSRFSRTTKDMPLTVPSMNAESIKLISQYLIESKESLPHNSNIKGIHYGRQMHDRVKGSQDRAEEEEQPLEAIENQNVRRRFTLLQCIPSLHHYKLKQSQISLLRSAPLSTERLSRQEMSFNISPDRVGDVAEFSLEDIPKLGSALNAGQTAIYGKLIDLTSKLQSIICQKNRLILHLDRKLSAVSMRIPRDATDNKSYRTTQQDTSYLGENFSEDGRIRIKVEAAQAPRHSEAQSFELIIQLTERVEQLECDMHTSEKNERALLELNNKYVQEIEHLQKVNERYQSHYQAELAKNVKMTPCAPCRMRSPKFLAGRLSPLQQNDS